MNYNCSKTKCSGKYFDLSKMNTRRIYVIKMGWECNSAKGNIGLGLRIEFCW
jgi:hypothetical protein